MNTEVIMGLPVDQVTYQTILAELPLYFENGKKMTAISINPQIAVDAKKYPDIVEFIKQSTHRIPDGIGIVLVSQLTGGKIKERVAGFDLMVKFLEYADNHQKRVFFYGAKPEVLFDAIEKTRELYPNLTITGGIDGYTSLSEVEVVEMINRAKPDFLFVALGFPRQEQWLARNTSRLNVTVLQDVGGSFDVLSGRVKRAPKMIINLHLEWLYRSLSNPKRIGRIIQLPIFVVKSLWWKVRGDD
ncbi:WecB/TagA/CpsF family glycosyltransferase [Enterococcus casseliflavus]|uniref:WecB/TagA/CpsF family glycosyltransferase n=1 Tax=Enterococcus casseliflavus TaxID=37734 RepID=UPI0030165ECF